MTNKNDDIELVNKIINWCKIKYSRKECDADVYNLYVLACTASLYLSGRALEEQEYYDKYGNKIYDLAKKYGIYTCLDEQIDEITKRQGKWDNSRPLEEAKKDIVIPASAFDRLNKAMNTAHKENAIQRTIGEEAMREEIIGGRDD